MPFSVAIEQQGLTTVVRLGGELDIATAGKLRRTLLDLVTSDCAAILVDMAGVAFMDSSGLAVLVAGHKRARHEGIGFGVARLTPTVGKVFALTRADQLMPVLDEVGELPPEEDTVDSTGSPAAVV